MKPEQTQGGGFAGGVFTGPGAAPPRSSLFELADALGATGGQVVGGLVDDFGKRIETNKKAALDEAAIFEQTTAGYTSEMLQAEIDSEPMAAKFKANPYLLPAINVYRGRKLADELGLRMVQEGIDTGDAEAVQAFYQNNAPDLSDPFYARGFNEQNARLQAQFSQQQLKDAIQDAERTAMEGASTVWIDAFNATGDINMATAALRESEFGKDMSGFEVSEIQFAMAGKLAAEGNIEAFDALVNTPRGDAPPLAQSAQYLRDIAVLRKEAERTRSAKEDGFRRAAQSRLLKAINDGIGEAALLASPDWAALARPGQQEGELSEEQFSLTRAFEAERMRRKDAAERLEHAEHMERMMAAAEERAAALMQSGNGWMIQAEKITDPATGKSKTLSASSLVNGSIAFTRRQMLGEQPFALQGEEAAAYRKYTDSLAKSGFPDPMMQKAVAGFTSGLTVEGLQESPEGALQAYTIFSNIGEKARSVYFPDDRTRTIMERTENFLNDNPRVDPLVALKRSVAIASSPVRLGPSSTPVQKVIENSLLINPQGQRSAFGLGPRDKFAPDAAQLQDFVADRMLARRAFGMTEEEAAASVAKEVSEMFVAVNDVAVRLPESPLPSGQSPDPETWAKDVLQFITDFSNAEGIPSEELQVIWNSGNSYAVVRRDADGGEPELLGYTRAIDITIGAAQTREAAFSLLNKFDKSGTQTSLSDRIDSKRTKQEASDDKLFESLTNNYGNMK